MSSRQATSVNTAVTLPDHTFSSKNSILNYKIRIRILITFTYTFRRNLNYYQEPQPNSSYSNYYYL